MIDVPARKKKRREEIPCLIATSNQPEEASRTLILNGYRS
jgi:hypothetical protein